MDIATDLRSKWPTYRSIKIVRAMEIASLNADAGLIVFVDGSTMEPEPNMFARYEPKPGDFAVMYEDGYTSISPRSAFTTGYVRA